MRLVIVGLLAFAAGVAVADGPEVQLENLMRSDLTGAEGLEVIVSRVTLPPNTKLPAHTHPGEEFAYVIEGSTTLWQDGLPDTAVGAGEAVKVAPGQLHTGSTGDEGATLVVFRIHTKGQPERVLAE